MIGAIKDLIWILPPHFHEECCCDPPHCDFIALQRPEQQCRLSLFRPISNMLFQQGFLPCMRGLLPAKGHTECWPCVSGAVCLKGDEYFQPCWKEGMQVSLSSLRRPPLVIIAAQLVRVQIQRDRPCRTTSPMSSLYFMSLCIYTDKISKVLKYPLLHYTPKRQYLSANSKF